MAYMVKQLNYVWLTAEIGDSITTAKYIKYINIIQHVSTACIAPLSRDVGKVLL